MQRGKGQPGRGRHQQRTLADFWANPPPDAIADDPIQADPVDPIQADPVDPIQADDPPPPDAIADANPSDRPSNIQSGSRGVAKVRMRSPWQAWKERNDLRVPDRSSGRSGDRKKVRTGGTPTTNLLPVATAAAQHEEQVLPIRVIEGECKALYKITLQIKADEYNTGMAIGSKWFHTVLFAKQKEASVTGVLPGSAADRSGLLRGDLLVINNPFDNQDRYEVMKLHEYCTHYQMRMRDELEETGKCEFLVVREKTPSPPSSKTLSESDFRLQSMITDTFASGVPAPQNPQATPPRQPTTPSRHGSPPSELSPNLLEKTPSPHGSPNLLVEDPPSPVDPLADPPSPPHDNEEVEEVVVLPDNVRVGGVNLPVLKLVHDAADAVNAAESSVIEHKRWEEAPPHPASLAEDYQIKKSWWEGCHTINPTKVSGKKEWLSYDFPADTISETTKLPKGVQVKNVPAVFGPAKQRVSFSATVMDTLRRGAKFHAGEGCTGELCAKMWVYQDFRCMLCGVLTEMDCKESEECKAHFDHNHEDCDIRNVLCRTCNVYSPDKEAFAAFTALHRARFLKGVIMAEYCSKEGMAKWKQALNGAIKNFKTMMSQPGGFIIPHPGIMAVPDPPSDVDTRLVNITKEVIRTVTLHQYLVSRQRERLNKLNEELKKLDKVPDAQDHFWLKYDTKHVPFLAYATQKQQGKFENRRLRSYPVKESSDHNQSVCNVPGCILMELYEKGKLRGTVVSTHHGSVSSLSSSSFDKKAYQKIVVALLSVETDLSTSGGDLSSVYNYVGLRTMQAQQWGYKHLADQAFRNGASVQLEQVDQLHHDLVEAVVPFVCKFNKIEKPKSLVDDYTGATGKTYKEDLIDVNVYNAKVDRFNMLKLEDHVTLDGALSFLFRVADDLLGVTFEMVEKQRRSSYDSEIHYYQVFDKDHKLLGSFYLDPFRAIYHDEVQPVTLPLVPRGPNTPPVVYLRLGAATRMFDSDPQGLSWDEVESLFHEFGHLFQFMRAASDHGAVLGPQNMPMDLSEILPKFMELWLTEQSTIYALMNLSNTTETFKDETLQAAFRNRAHNKSLLIAQNVFLGAVELELFSGFDLKGSESVLDMQRRLAEEIVPHDLPDKKDLTLITDLLLENANGREVCRYRYTLGDVLAASLYESCRRRHTEDPSKLQQDFLRVLVEPGANVNLKDIQETFGIQDLSIKPLLDRYCF